MRTASYAVLALAAISAIACSDSTSPAAGKSVSVSFNTSSGMTAVASRSSVFGPRLSLMSTSGSDTLIITRVQLVISKMELAQADTGCATQANGQDDCPDLHLQPILFDLPVDTAVKSVLNQAVPAGTYTGFEAKIDAVHQGEDESGVSDFLAAHPDFAGTSVRVEGTFNGTPFVYTGNAEGEVHSQFVPPITVDSTGINITINVNTASWFRTQAGALIDPSTANAGGANASVVAENIKNSFHAFEDDNHDGHED